MTTTQSAHTVETPPDASGETLRTQFEFYQLARPIQDRLLLSLGGEGVPVPSLFAPASQPPPFLWWGLLGVGFTGLILLTKVGFGDLDHAHAIQLSWVGAGYTIAAGMIAVAVVGWLRHRGQAGRYPYRLGDYLFPIGVVKMVADQVRILPITELRKVTQGGGKLQLEFASERVSFPLPAGLDVPRLEEQLAGFRAEFETAWNQRNLRALAKLDPTRDSGFSNPLSSVSRLQPAPERRSIRLIAALVIGGLLGTGWFLARNRLAERALYRRAVTENSEASLTRYLERGGARAEVRETLLPRAKLAASRGSLTAVEQFAAANPNSQIQPEIDAALRAELLAELARVQAQGTLSALDQFRAEHPSHSLVLNELTQIRHRLYQTALTRYTRQYNPDPAVAALVADLLKFAEANGPKVEVRFRRSLTSSAERADSAIRRSGYYTGSAAIPSQYFDAPHAAAREQAVGVTLVERLQSAFPSEILQFSLGESGEGTGALPEPKVPTLFVSYSTNMSGGFTTNRPRGVYVGLGVTFQSAFVIPPATRAFEFKDSSWLAPDVNEISREMMTPNQLYETNARTALERFRDRLLSRLMPTPKTP